jgi:intraflagellar transport protein 88
MAPILDSRDWEVGFDWVVDTLKADHEHLASQMEIEKALQYLKDKQYDKAIEYLKAFEKKDQHLRAMAATNLSFMYFLEGEFRNADTYADLAIRHDRYNAKVR